MTDYREPIKLKSVREVNNTFGIQQTGAEIHAEIDISTDEGKRAMHMLKTGLACPNCYLTFASPPCAANLKDFEGTFNLFPVALDLQRRRVRAGACNLCGFAVSNENIEKTVYDEAMSLAKKLYDELGDGS